ncbi:MAG: hypothetical protein AAGI17_08925, partial [Planctomycetota bacterium]
VRVVGGRLVVSGRLGLLWRRRSVRVNRVLHLHIEGPAVELGDFNEDLGSSHDTGSRLVALVSAGRDTRDFVIAAGYPREMLSIFAEVLSNVIGEARGSLGPVVADLTDSDVIPPQPPLSDIEIERTERGDLTMVFPAGGFAGRRSQRVQLLFGASFVLAGAAVALLGVASPSGTQAEFVFGAIFVVVGLFLLRSAWEQARRWQRLQIVDGVLQLENHEGRPEIWRYEPGDVQSFRAVRRPDGEDSDPAIVVIGTPTTGSAPRGRLKFLFDRDFDELLWVEREVCAVLSLAHDQALARTNR